LGKRGERLLQDGIIPRLVFLPLRLDSCFRRNGREGVLQSALPGKIPLNPGTLKGLPLSYFFTKVCGRDKLKKDFRDTERSHFILLFCPVEGGEGEEQGNARGTAFSIQFIKFNSEPGLSGPGCLGSGNLDIVSGYSDIQEEIGFIDFLMEQGAMNQAFREKDSGNLVDSIFFPVQIKLYLSVKVFKISGVAADETDKLIKIMFMGFLDHEEGLGDIG
jgi:hypothetical protein